MTTSRYDWMLDELTNAGRENLDVEHASEYDSKEDAGAGVELSLLKEFGLDGQSQVIDIGAGTGQFTLAAAAACERVVAVDVSPVMLAVLREKVAESGLSNVEVVQSGFLTYEHQGPPADCVYSRYALHHIPDFWKVLALHRLRSLVRPGGILRLWDIVYGFEPSEAERRLENWCATIAPDVEDGWTRADIEEHVRDEHSTFTWLLEPMLERNGFRIEDAAYTPDGIFARYVARAV